jgi:preprotein translocase subunit SecG
VVYFAAGPVYPLVELSGDTILETSLRIVEVILAVAMIILILMQSRGTSLGTVFGQEGSVFHTRRGAERILFYVSIGTVVVFLMVALGLAHVAA